MATRNAATTAEIATAYTASANGDIINLTGTNYAVNGSWNSPTGTKTVTFQGQGRTVTKFGMLNIKSSNSLWLDIGCQTMTNCPYYDLAAGIIGSNVTVVRADILQGYRTSIDGNGWIQPEPYIACLGLESGGPGWEFYDCVIGDGINAKGCQLVAANTLFDHCVLRNCFLDNTGRDVGSGEEVHLEGMQNVSASFMTIRRSIFMRLNVMGIHFTNYGSGPPTTDITLENNLWLHSVDAVSLSQALASDPWHPSPRPFHVANMAAGGQLGQYTRWNVRYNTFETEPVFEGTRPAVDCNWIGNAGKWSNLGAGWTYRYNVGTKIHATDTAVTPAASVKGTPAPFGWVDGKHPAYDFRLTSNSVLRDKGDPADFPAVDLDGVARA